MFKRSMKITALLVSAASIISSVPTMAATRLGTKDGTVEKGVAFKDGRYVYQGYRSDDDDSGLYYNDGGKDKMLDDADELGNKFDDKYVDALDGNDHYVVDMSTGKINDDDTIDDLEETAKTKLKNKLDNTDRYTSSVSIADGDFNRVGSNRFEDLWYSYNATTSGTSNKIGMFGYTTDSGKYIDTSFDLNIYGFYNPTTGSSASAKTYKIEDVEDDADIKDKDNNSLNMSIDSLKFIKYLGQDDKYIYSIIQVGIKNAMDFGDCATPENERVRTSYYIQKVSKTQGDKEKKAYKTKDTECFEISDQFKNSDAKDAYDVLMKFVPGNSAYDDKAQVSIVDGAIYVTANDGDDKVKTYKLQMKTSQKLNIYANGSKTNDKIGAHIVIKDSDVDTDVTDEEAWAVDSNGAVWAINKGNIMKSSKGGDFKTIYTCDRSLNRLDVYDDENLIAWDKDGDVYTTVSEGSEAAKEEAEEIVGPKEPVKVGWEQLTDGNWILYDANGAKATGWSNSGGIWYYLDKNTGLMRTGWLNDGGAWYYLNPNSNGTKGAMQTGWIYEGGNWYYLQSSGAMKVGWLNDSGTWYYLNQSGAMLANTTVDGYKLGSSGAWIQ